jgi:signal peptidase I
MTNDPPVEKPIPQLGMVPTVPRPGRADAHPPKPSPRKSIIDTRNLGSQFFKMALIALLSLGCYFVISRYVVEAVQVVGQSMFPTLHDSDHYLLNHWATHRCGPRHLDVVVIRDPGDHGISVKRVIAVAGDCIYFKHGKVYVNHRELSESYLPEHTHTWTYNRAHEQLILCGKDQYYVLGDNRQASIDSRAYGPVPRQNILGLLMPK